MTKHYDKYMWKPKVFETAEEINCFLRENQISKKLIRKINTIGAAFNMSKRAYTEALEEILADIGVSQKDIDAGRYPPWTDMILMPCEVRLCEPTVIIFTDDTTLELMPTDDQKLLMSVNQIPAAVTDGLNHRNYNPRILFKNVVGSSISYADVYQQQTTLKYGNGHRDEQRSSVSFQFWFDIQNDHGLLLRHIRSSQYSFSVFRQNYSRNWECEIVSVPFSTIKKAADDKSQKKKRSGY